MKKIYMLFVIIIFGAFILVAIVVNQGKMDETMGCFTENNISNFYESYEDFPFEAMEHIDNIAFEYIKTIYAEIDFESDFSEGDKSTYDFYKEKYKQLLSGECTFIHMDTGEERVLPDYKTMLVYDGEKDIYDVSRYIYTFFDMDEDGTPELCIYIKGVLSAPAITGICIFKYDEQMDKIVLWEELSSCYFYIYGSKVIGCDWKGGVERGFYCLNERAEIDLKILFVEGNFNGVATYMVSMPKYSENNIYIPREIESQLYYDNCEELFYFKVTEEQYYELTEAFFDGRTHAMAYFEDNGVTYSELFE